jgi:hypothetical protein
MTIDASRTELLTIRAVTFIQSQSGLTLPIRLGTSLARIGLTLGVLKAPLT